jgi:hypothetical protein
MINSVRFKPWVIWVTIQLVALSQFKNNKHNFIVGNRECSGQFIHTLTNFLRL